ncbi:MAG: hypothetical protein KF847_10085 [Pirellulales bacterium]|nr:hypothetical protein [Pirellulales bacterium]
MLFGQRSRCAVATVFYIALQWPLLRAGAQARVTQADLDRYVQWGYETIANTEMDMGRPFSELYWEGRNATSGHKDFAYVWPLATQFRAYTGYVQSNPAFDPNATIRLRKFSDQARSSYWYDSGTKGYGVYPGSSERFYDDNAHWVVSFVEAYRVTGDAVYLDRAKETHQFVMSGEDSHQGGGIYFKETSTRFASNKNTVSTLQAARGAAMLYQATGESRYLSQSLRLLTWAQNKVQASDGMYYQDARSPINTLANTPLTNAAGMGILTNLELYDALGDLAYLAEAQRVATALEARYFQGRIRQEGYWAFEAVEALVELYKRDHNSYWLEEVKEGLDFIRADVRDAKGDYGPNWGSSYKARELSDWYLNDQAAVARAFFVMGLTDLNVVPEPNASALILLCVPALTIRSLRRRQKHVHSVQAFVVHQRK